MAETLGDFRFDGYSNEQLSDQVHKLKAGMGAKALQPAIDTLHSIAQDLNATNTLLTNQLAKIGIDWQSVAGQGAQDQMASSVHFTDGAQYNISDTTGGLTTQSDSHTVAQNAPAPSSDNQKNTWDNVTGFFGYQTDHAKEVEQANADRQTAIQHLTNYQSNSKDALSSAQPIGQPPGINLTAQPIQSGPSTTSLAGYLGSPSGYAGPSGGGGYVPSSVPGAGTGGYTPPPAVTGGSSPVLPPGVSTGVGPGAGSPTGGMPAAASAASGMLAEEIGLGAALAGGAGAVAAGASSSNPDAIVRGGGSAAGEDRAGSPSRASVTSGAIDEEQAAQARAAARIAPPTRPASAMMQPAATGKGKKDEDSEHDRKYVIDEDLFGDTYKVVPTVIGEDRDA